MAASIAASLAQTKPFNLVPRQEIERLAPSCASRHLKPGSIVSSEVDWRDNLWIITGGLLRLSMQASFGGTTTVGIMRPGDIVGCLNGVCRHKHPMEGLVIGDCLFIVVPRPLYLDLLRYPEFSLGIIHILGERLWDAQVMRAVAAQDSEKRLAWILLWLYGKLGRSIPMTRQLIAEAAGVARETSIRILSPMEKKGWIKTRRGVIELNRPDKLREALDSRD
jgi:CRP-like cAMP-binding protein